MLYLWTPSLQAQPPKTGTLTDGRFNETHLTLRSSTGGKGTLSDSPYQLKLRLTPEGHSIRVALEPESFPPTGGDFPRPFLDAAPREATYLLKHIQRDLETGKGNAAFEKRWLQGQTPILFFPMRLAVRNLDGSLIKNFKWRMALFPDGLQAIRIKGPLGKNDFEKSFLLGALHHPDVYSSFLKALFSPVETVRLPLPKNKEFVVELNYSWPIIPGCFSKDRLLHCRDPLSLYVRNWLGIHISPPDTYYHNLGNTFCYQENGRLKQVSAAHLNLLRDSLELKEKAQNLFHSESSTETIEGFRAYFARVPSDRGAARTLLNLYRQKGYQSRALSLATDYQPYFVHVREPHQVRGKLEQAREHLRANSKAFKKSEAGWVKITLPLEGDLVSEDTDVQFVIAGGQSPLLNVDISLNGAVSKSLGTTPFQTNLPTSGKGSQHIGVRANFENATFQEDTIQVKSMRIDQQHQVNLVALQAVVKRSGKPVNNLLVSDFQLRENDVPVKLNSWSRADRPLRLAVLLDTSISMSETHIYPAQWALFRLISGLGDQDASQVYSFDEKVLRIKDFGQKPAEVKPTLFSLSPGSFTALNDALLTARSSLLEHKGATKVLIVIAGGDDNRSSATTRQIKALMARSPIRIYAVIMKKSERGFLAKLAQMTGGYARIATTRRSLDGALTKIREEIQGLYYFSYTSSVANEKNRQLSLQTKSSKYKVKWKLVP